MEIWENIVGFEGLYTISNNGQVLSFGNRFHRRENKILKPSKDKDGYFFVVLYKNKKAFPKRIHRLIGNAFILNPDNKPQINHIDGDRSNNCLNNLEWCTASENKKHSYDIGLSDAKGEKCGTAKLINEDIFYIRKKFKEGKKQKELSVRYNINPSEISRIINNKRWAHI